MLRTKTRRYLYQLSIAEGQKGKEIKSFSGHDNCDGP